MADIDAEDEGAAREQLRALHHALIEAYDANALAQLARFGLDASLDHIVWEQQTVPAKVLELIRWSERHSCVPELIAAAYNENNQNDKLAEVIVQATEWPICVARGLTLHEGKASLFAKRAQEEAYLRSVQRQYEGLADRYVPLAAVQVAAGGSAEAKTLDGTALRALVAPGSPALICGGAGAGKTAVLQKTAYACALEAYVDKGAPLPLYVPLEGWDGNDLLEHLRGCFHGWKADDRGRIDLGEHLPSYLKHCRVVLLLDDLDHPRLGAPAVYPVLSELLATHFPDARIAATARQAKAASVLHLDPWRLQPLDVAAQTAFVHAYVDNGASERLLSILAGSADDFTRAAKLGMQPHLLGLADSPRLLEQLCNVYGDAEGRSRLVGNLGALLEVDVIGTLWAHAGERMGQSAPQQARVFQTLADLALQLREQAPPTGQRDMLATAANAGLLADMPEGGADGEPSITFAHPLIEDYFVALAMRRALDTGGDMRQFGPRQEQAQAPDRWERPAIMLAGILPDMAAFVLALVPYHPIAAARCIGESGGVLGGQDVTGEVRKTVKDAVRAALTRMAESWELAHVLRCTAGDALSYVGDYRDGVNLLDTGVPQIAWQLVGEGEGAFALARYPVTNLQFDVFYRYGGYEAKVYWSDDGWQWRTQHNAAAPDMRGNEFDLPNHPAVAISWYEAEAFCNWLSELLGARVTLPSGRQWEQGAGAEDGRHYPHGNDLTPRNANYGQTGLKKTSAVGMFPLGVSPWGLLDMAGNVREWTTDRADGESQYLLRGGSFLDGADGLRCTHGIVCAAGRRDERTGFRLATKDPAILGDLRTL